MDDSFDLDEHGSNEFDNACFVVQAVYIFGMSWFREVMVWEFVFLYKTPIKAVDQGSTIEGFGDDIFIKSVFEDR